RSVFLYLVSINEAPSRGHVDQKEWRQRFFEEFLRSEDEKSTQFDILTKEKYLAFMQQVEEAEKTEKKSPLQQRRLKRLDVVEIGAVKKLTARNEENTNNTKYYLTVDELKNEFDICAQKFLVEEEVNKTLNFENRRNQIFSWNRPRFL
ncbi:unnamed protein product, partial [Acanthoscelides obtectus]